MARLIVTGGSGFIGRAAVTRARAAGFDVVAIGRHPPERAGSGVTHYAVDLIAERERACSLFREIGASHWLHLAWYVEHGRFWHARENFAWVAATIDLAEAFARGGGRRLVAAGSCAEYEWGHGLCREDSTPMEPATPYGVAKDALRRLLQSWSGEAGVSVAWGRVFFVYGPGERRERLVPSVTWSLLAGGVARCTHGTQRRDLLHVSDVADVFVRLLTSDYEGPLNIGSGEAVELQTVVRRIADIIGRPDLLELGAAVAPNEPLLLAADTTRLAEVLQWSPAFDLDSGLCDTIAWHRRDIGLTE